MKGKFSPVVVAFVSFCLVFFHSNLAFAAVIDVVAPPEDAATVPLELEEPDDAFGKLEGYYTRKQSPTTKRKIEIGCCRVVLFPPF